MIIVTYFNTQKDGLFFQFSHFLRYLYQIFWKHSVRNFFTSRIYFVSEVRLIGRVKKRDKSTLYRQKVDLTI